VGEMFGNMEQLAEFHTSRLLPQLLAASGDCRMVGRVFLSLGRELQQVYCEYCGNMERARAALAQLGEENGLLLDCQRRLGHGLPLSSYLLKPVQRLTKYQLLLGDLLQCCGEDPPARTTLDHSLQSVLTVIKAVNDSLHIPNIKGLPSSLQQLGALICQERFTVLTENRTQSQILFRPKPQTRQLLLYPGHLLLCKPLQDKAGGSLQFKLSLPTSSMGMSSQLKGEERKMEIWTIGQPDAFTLEAQCTNSKEQFAAQLRKVIAKEKGGVTGRGGAAPQSTALPSTDSLSATGSSSSGYGSCRQFSRARSLDQESWGRAAERLERSCSEERLLDSGGPHYTALADYTALTARELNLHLGDSLHLVKVGCAGWWYVRLAEFPYSEGWAPSTYLQAEPGSQRNRTLDRF